jgi:WD40 repeat protein
MAVALSPDGETAVTVSNVWRSTSGKAWLWDVATGKLLGPPMEHRGAIHDVAFSRHGSSILSETIDGTAQRWSATTLKSIGDWMSHESGAYGVGSRENGRRIATEGDRGACVWDAVILKRIGSRIF